MQEKMKTKYKNGQTIFFLSYVHMSLKWGLPQNDLKIDDDDVISCIYRVEEAVILLSSL